jgi:hypothetical protein
LVWVYLAARVGCPWLTRRVLSLAARGGVTGRGLTGAWADGPKVDLAARVG